MASVLHGSARTTPRIRAELQASKESARALAARYGLCHTTSWRGLIDSWCKGGRVGAPDDPLARWRLEMICGSKES